MILSTTSWNFFAFSVCLRRCFAMKSCHRTEVTATVDSSVAAAVCQWGPGDLPRNRLTESWHLLLVLTGNDIFFGS